MKKLIVANWKLNPPTPKAALALFRAYSQSAKKHPSVKIVACVPAVYLASLAKSARLSNVELGAQDCSSETDGAHTGEISAEMLKESGAAYVIIGHSERRARGETDELVNRKVRAALRAGLRAIICIGETTRDATGEYLEILRRQVQASLRGLKVSDWQRLIVAYEPVWAVGSQAIGVDTPTNFLEQAIFIRKIIKTLSTRQVALAVPILYGGSVDQRNALGFLSEGQAAGLLVGRASLRPERFAEIVLAG